MNKSLNEYLTTLKDVFVGGELQQPQRSWIVPVDEPFLDIYGAGVTIERDETRLDFGSVSPLHIERKSVSIANLTQQSLMIWVKEMGDCISAQWENNYHEILLEPSGGTAELHVTFNGSDVKEQSIRQTISLAAEIESGASKEIILPVHIHTFVNFPLASFNFNGTARPAFHDFGTIDPTSKDAETVNPYRLSIKNTGNEDIKCELHQLPQWLKVEVNREAVDTSDPEFQVESGAETIVSFHPLVSTHLLGKQKSYIRIVCNDIRPDFKDITLPFSIKQEIKDAYVTYEEPPYLEVNAGESRIFSLQLLNWGNSPAIIHRQDKSGPVTINLKQALTIPPAGDGTPQKKELPAVITAKNLAPGNHQLKLPIIIRDSSRETLTVPINVTVIAIKEPVGKLCTNCHLVSDKEFPFCSLCGLEIRDAKEIFAESVVTCPECSRMYEAVIKYCPVDGKHLNKF